MRKYKFNKPLVESELPPKDTNVLWVDINESTSKLQSIKEWDGTSWVNVMQGGVISQP